MQPPPSLHSDTISECSENNLSDFAPNNIAGNDNDNSNIPCIDLTDDNSIAPPMRESIVHPLYTKDTLKKARRSGGVKLNIVAPPTSSNNSASPVQIIVTPPVLMAGLTGLAIGGQGVLSASAPPRFLTIGRFSSITSDISETFSDDFSSMYGSSELSEYSEAPVTPLSLSLQMAPSSTLSLDSLSLSVAAANYTHGQPLPFPRLEMTFTDSPAESIRVFLAVNRFTEVYNEVAGIPGAGIAQLKKYLEQLEQQQVDSKLTEMSHDQPMVEVDA